MSVCIGQEKANTSEYVGFPAWCEPLPMFVQCHICDGSIDDHVVKKQAHARTDAHMDVQLGRGPTLAPYVAACPRCPIMPPPPPPQSIWAPRQRPPMTWQPCEARPQVGCPSIIKARGINTTTNWPTQLTSRGQTTPPSCTTEGSIRTSVHERHSPSQSTRYAANQ